MYRRSTQRPMGKRGAEATPSPARKKRDKKSPSKSPAAKPAAPLTPDAQRLGYEAWLKAHSVWWDERALVPPDGVRLEPRLVAEPLGVGRERRRRLRGRRLARALLVALLPRRARRGLRAALSHGSLGGAAIHSTPWLAIYRERAAHPNDFSLVSSCNQPGPLCNIIGWLAGMILPVIYPGDVGWPCC